ncbi:hypothetical protein ACFVUW_10545 [Streptomyces xiamenensis]|uniref:hypothetical protein n=1 Tax=Streptomyces xiamenensis TaxID=408015 RepID=UPI0036E7FE5A
MNNVLGDLSRAVAFCSAWLMAEHVAVTAEPGTPPVKRAFTEAQRYLNEGLLIPAGPVELQADQQLFTTLKPGQCIVHRQLFAVALYHHDHFGDVVEAYVGDIRDELCGAYGLRLHAVRRDGKLTVVSTDRPADEQPAGNGQHGVSWVHTQGTQITGLTELVAVRTLAVPKHQRSLQDWRKLKQTEMEPA